MERSSDTGRTEVGQYVCSLVGSTIRCKNAHTDDEVSIEINDILCALPDRSQEGLGYKVSYLHRRLEEKDSSGQGQDARLESIRTASLPPTLLSQHLCTEIPAHLSVASRDRRTNLHIILSLGSGVGGARNAFKNSIQPFLSFLGLNNYEVHETSSGQTIAELARSFLQLARNGVSQTIILVSGDGGLTDVVDVFYSNDNLEMASFCPPTIALIASGTGNAMASSTGLLDHPISGLMTLLRGRPEPIPVLCASFSPGSQYITDEGRRRISLDDNGLAGQPLKIYGAVVASWGMHASLVADSDTAEYRKFGADRFKMAAKELLYPSSGDETHKYNGIVTFTMLNSETRKVYTKTINSSQHMYVLATLVPNLERDFRISPDSKALDGRLRVIHFGPMSPERAMQLMGLAYQNGKHVHEETVTYTEVEGLKIELLEEDEKWRRVCIDGKIITVQQGGWMEVHKEAKHLLNLVTHGP